MSTEPHVSGRGASGHERSVDPVARPPARGPAQYPLNASVRTRRAPARRSSDRVPSTIAGGPET